MCGIAGYVGHQNGAPIILKQLKRLDYRGYDSAGMGMCTADKRFLVYYKEEGSPNDLAKNYAQSPLETTCAIGHTRWATHGEPTAENCHPHLGGNDIANPNVLVVHNGTITNFQELRERLTAKGYIFRSETDTESIAHLIDYHLGLCAGDCRKALLKTLEELKGSYALAILFKALPDVIFVARQECPLLIGPGVKENFVSSDPVPLAGYVSEVIHLQDGDVLAVSASAIEVLRSKNNTPLVREPIDQTLAESVGMGRFGSFMLKEISEQPATLENALIGRIDQERGTAYFQEMKLPAEKMRSFKRIVLTACGTSWHAALIGRLLFKELACLPADVEYASEFRYDPSLIPDDTLIVAISQSGETADTLGALQECQRRGFNVLAICNASYSSIARLADAVLLLKAGPEIGVASTKAFTSQVMTLTLLALYMGRLRQMPLKQGQEILEELEKIPLIASKVLESDHAIAEIAQQYQVATNALYLGIQYNFPMALEGALKLKEISYIHAEGYPAAEIKHGPIALVDKNMPTVFIMPPPGFLHERIMRNVHEIKSRKGKVIAIACHTDLQINQVVDNVIRVPKVPDYLQPIINAIPLQLLAYHLATLKGCNVDRPRNLAKSVTVE